MNINLKNDEVAFNKTFSHTCQIFENFMGEKFGNFLWLKGKSEKFNKK